MLEIEVVDAEDGEALERAATEAALAAGFIDGHLAVTIVGEEEIRRLNREHRGRDEPTDVLSFPVDGGDDSRGPRELGDVMICPEHTTDVVEATVHGVLHLCGYDHEADSGEMLALQDKLMAGIRK